ncbi:uncharacterized protein LOC117386474 [Periophthalmus magnuspinnatus]|uniref:uncharacterized protein LOC117386474 n=1 Tax=Periophthalmus magnuspinnatus TaxID=409849 RepID=UPI00145A4938|nr:uncharacterized protein LOC117386474 [Periophthalmus magnuspinnatus]
MFLFSSVLMMLWTESQGLRVSPDRSPLFRWDSVVLYCENPDWILLRTTRLDSGTRCGESWGEPREIQCFLPYIDPMDSGWYWCESRDGQSQGGRNITVTDQFGPRAETPPPFTETLSPDEYTPSLSTEASPSSERPPAVALLCHLLMLCPYVVSTVIMLSLCRHMHSGNQEQPIIMMSLREAERELDEHVDNITVVTTEYCF